ncbi:hypothetical protein THOM_1869 [Trachipleistophora hominis]|uniref:Uncharacterized protein n=1 Tax=Trachipleistophora hominis TaxID=72359 RepID=L7JWU9_TRAHO|nr:hypothetical protein THOM_1869 [Trachipleistophora hominis]
MLFSTIENICGFPYPSRMNKEIYELLDKLTIELANRKTPTDLQEALTYEATSLYVYYTLETMKNKLENKYDKDVIEKVQGLEKYFNEHIEPCTNESLILEELYGKHDHKSL